MGVTAQSAPGPAQDTTGSDPAGGVAAGTGAGAAWLARHANAVWALVLAVGALWLFAYGMGDYPLWDPWEPKYAQTIREMGERGEIITPWFDDRIRWTKPILIYWAMGVPMALFGNNELTARLPSALAATALVLFVYFFVGRLRDRRTGVIAACALATMPQFFYLSRQAMPDMLLNAWLGAAMGCFALARFGGRRERLWYLLFYASLGLAVLTKGPLAIAITAGALGLFWLLDAQPRRWMSPRNALADLKAAWARYHVGPGIVVFTLIAAPWYVAMYFKHGDALVDRFVMDENLQRFSEPIRDHHGTSEYYVEDLFHGMYPWVGLLPVGIVFLLHGLRRVDEETRQRWYWVAWLLAVFILFTLAGTKLDHYVLPLTPALAVLVALVFEAYFREDAPRWPQMAMLVSIPFLAMPVRDFLVEGNRAIFSVFTNARDIEHEGLDGKLKLLLVAWAVAMVLGFVLRRSRLAVTLAVLVAFAHGAYMLHDVLPAHTSQRTMKYYIDTFNASREPDAELVFYGKIRYSTHYYFGRKNYRHFASGEADELADYVRGKQNVYIIARSSRATRLGRTLRGRSGMRLYLVRSDHPRYHLVSTVRPERP